MYKNTCKYCSKLFVTKRRIRKGHLCPSCDKEIENLMKEERQQNINQSSKRKCRNCRESLIPTRYFYCLNCIPNEDMPADDVMWDYMLPIDDKQFHSPDRRIIEFKEGRRTCKICKETKDILSGFDQYRCKGRPTPVVRTFCKKCSPNYYKNYYKNRRQKLTNELISNND